MANEVVPEGVDAVALRREKIEYLLNNHGELLSLAIELDPYIKLSSQNVFEILDRFIVFSQKDHFSWNAMDLYQRTSPDFCRRLVDRMCSWYDSLESGIIPSGRSYIGLERAMVLPPFLSRAEKLLEKYPMAKHVYEFWKEIIFNSAKHPKIVANLTLLASPGAQLPAKLELGYAAAITHAYQRIYVEQGRAHIFMRLKALQDDAEMFVMSAFGIENRNLRQAIFLTSVPPSDDNFLIQGVSSRLIKNIISPFWVSLFGARLQGYSSNECVSIFDLNKLDLADTTVSTCLGICLEIMDMYVLNYDRVAAASNSLDFIQSNSIHKQVRAFARSMRQ